MASKEVLEAVKNALNEDSNKKRKFIQSIDLVITLKDVDLKKPENRIDEEIELPKGRGKEAKIAVFASGELAFKAKNIADMVITPEQIKDFAENKLKAKEMAEQYDFFIAEAPLMPNIGKALGKIFAPRGKMPKPVQPDVDIESTIAKLRNSIRARSKDKNTFHCLVGKEDMPLEDIAENIDIILNRVETHLERGRMNIKAAYISTTMGSPVRVI
jgi:large subunit ribosomal protein L1